MGQEGQPSPQRVKFSAIPPESDEVEVIFFGPGYGECILVHIGNGRWIIVDSCLDTGRRSTALNYLRSLGSNPSDSVCLVVATHWHDDHIKGMAELVEVCDKAIFSCAAALGKEEFLAVLAALERRPATATGSGLRELHKVFSLLAERSATCKFAMSNRLIFSQEACMIWSLSPSDRAYHAFLQQIGQFVPKGHEAKKRVPPLMPNDAAVVLLVSVGNTTILLGADLERRGWLEVLDVYNQPDHKPTVFKVPHHGSQDAHEDRVWNEILDEDPIVALTPWRRGGRELPTKSDALRIIGFSSRAYVTANMTNVRGPTRHRHHNAVDKTIRESGVRIRTMGLSTGMVRLRKKGDSQADWNIENVGSACRLVEYI